MTGIPRNTLIAWERRYGLLNPERRENGYRRYTEHDVSQLLKVKNALTAGLKISEAVELLHTQSAADAEQAKLPPELEEKIQPISEFSMDTPYARMRQELLAALVSYRGQDASEILARLVTVSFSIRLQEVYFPVLHEIGDRWERGDISIAQEHFATGLIKNHLAAIFVSTPAPALDAEHVVSVTMPHDEHEIAALALAIHLSLKGRRVTYLGSKLPKEELIQFCLKHRPQLVCISCITLPSRGDLRLFTDALRPVVQQGTRVVMGGTSLVGVEMDPLIEVAPNWGDFKVD
jgi:MerR family transcriptional regulator, light-induced transcriptional regulator